MRYSIQHYAAALLEALEKKSEREKKEIIKRFFTVLQKHSAFPRLPYILKEIERGSLKRLRLRKVFIESAGEISSEIKHEIKKSFDDKVFLQEKINPKLLAGIRILIDDEVLIDASGKRRLQRLFKK